MVIHLDPARHSLALILDWAMIYRPFRPKKNPTIERPFRLKKCPNSRRLLLVKKESFLDHFGGVDDFVELLLGKEA